MAATVADLRKAASEFCVRGTVLGSGTTKEHPRLEIDEFVRDTTVCNLFLLALQNLQDGESVKKVKAFDRLKGKKGPLPPDLEPWGWFQICSIYGLPAGAWQGVTEQSLIDSGQVKPTDDYWQPANPTPPTPAPKPQPDQTKGYGHHDSILFPMWHRTYLAMMEQAISLKMYEIADKFDPKKRPQYVEAAERFRLPYWDPFVMRELYEPTLKGSTKGNAPTYRAGLPKILFAKEVKVEEPNGYVRDIDNPLYQYKFPLIEKGNKQEAKYEFNNDGPLRLQEMFTAGGTVKLNEQVLKVKPNMCTVRAPGPDGRTDHRSIEDLICGFQGSTWIATGSILARLLRDTSKKWEDFSNKASGKAPGIAFTTETDSARLRVRRHSIETLSDRICGWIGGLEGYRGHMSHPNWSAFDPIFWLHHCNMDRLTAIHQYLTDPRTKYFPSTPAPGPAPVPVPRWEQYSSSATFTTPADCRQTPNSPLAPFRRSASPLKFWTSADASDHRVFGYTYHDIPPALSTLPARERYDAAAWLSRRVERLYGWFDPVPRTTTIPGLEPFTFYEPTHNWTNALQRPPRRHLTGFPVDHGEANEKTLALHPSVLMDAKERRPATSNFDFSPYDDRAANRVDTRSPIVVFETYENTKAEIARMQNPGPSPAPPIQHIGAGP